MWKSENLLFKISLSQKFTPKGPKTLGEKKDIDPGSMDEMSDEKISLFEQFSEIEPPSGDKRLSVDYTS